MRRIAVTTASNRRLPTCSHQSTHRTAATTTPPCTTTTHDPTPRPHANCRGQLQRRHAGSPNLQQPMHAHGVELTPTPPPPPPPPPPPLRAAGAGQGDPSPPPPRRHASTSLISNLCPRGFLAISNVRLNVCGAVPAARDAGVRGRRRAPARGHIGAGYASKGQRACPGQPHTAVEGGRAARYWGPQPWRGPLPAGCGGRAGWWWSVCVEGVDVCGARGGVVSGGRGCMWPGPWHCHPALVRVPCMSS